VSDGTWSGCVFRRSWCLAGPHLRIGGGRISAKDSTRHTRPFLSGSFGFRDELVRLIYDSIVRFVHGKYLQTPVAQKNCETLRFCSSSCITDNRCRRRRFCVSAGGCCGRTRDILEDFADDGYRVLVGSFLAAHDGNRGLGVNTYGVRDVVADHTGVFHLVAWQPFDSRVSNIHFH